MPVRSGNVHAQFVAAQSRLPQAKADAAPPAGLVRQMNHKPDGQMGEMCGRYFA